MTSFPAKVIYFLAASPFVWRAAWRLRRHHRERIDQLAETLRRVPASRWPYLRRPGPLAATAEIWLTWLPPPGFGHCLARSLLLQDLWSRCGLEPTLHLGAGLDTRSRHFHAWVTTPNDGPSTSSDGHAEIWCG